MDVLGITPRLLELTKTHEVNWTHENGTPCYTIIYDQKTMVLCRTQMDDGRMAILFNEVDANYNITGQINRWEEDQKTFTIVNELYNEAENSLAQHA